MPPGHPPPETCLGCRIAKRLDIVDDDQVHALHGLAMLTLSRRDAIKASRERGFDIGAPHVLSAIEDEMAEMFAVRPPSTTTVN